MEDYQQWNILVDKTNIARASIEISDLPELEEDQILLKIDGYALTANNISYASAGDMMGYWNFFPAQDRTNGIVPVWGYATIVETANLEFEVGMRFYGFYPMGSHVIVTPNEGDTSSGFVDIAQHRAEMAPIYNHYHKVSDTHIGDHETEALRAIVQPLFMTSFLIEHQFRNETWFDAQNIVITSASSKTAMALAYMVRGESEDIRRIGITSAANRDFTTESDLYDEVITYDDMLDTDIGLDPEENIVLVDFAGSAKTLCDIHKHMGDNLKFSSRIGLTHVAEVGDIDDIVGPKPVFFFAPAAAQEFIHSFGQAEFDAQSGRALYGFMDYMAGQLDIITIDGPEHVKQSYEQLLQGKISANQGLYVVV